MKRKSVKLVLASALLAISTAFLLTAEEKFSGLMFGDYYNVLGNHNTAVENQHGFWFRRVYFTYDNKLSDNWKLRFRLELNSPGDFVTKSTINPYLKDAYLSYEKGNHALFFGLINTPTYEKAEEGWGYRAMERTPFDLQGLVSARDLGIGAKGSFGQDKKISYSFVFGNGSTTKAETNKGKKVYGSLGFKLNSALLLEAYGDYESADNNKTLYMFQGLASWKRGKARAGLLYGHKYIKDGNADTTTKVRILSAYGVYTASAKIDLVLRADRVFDPNANGPAVTYSPFAGTNPMNILLAGIGWNVAKNVQVIPNLMFVAYDRENGVKPDSDIYGKITLFYKW